MQAAKCFSYPIFLFLLLFLTACSSQTTIVHDLREREANEILTYLNDRNLPAVKQQAEATGAGAKGDVKWNILVPAERANEAMAILNAVGLPRIPGETLLDVFTNTALVPSDMEQKIRYQAALAQQLASNIRKFQGVIDATVNLSIPPEDPLNPGATKGQVTASVYVRHDGVLDDPNSHLESKIRRLVSSGIPNLSYDNVTVVPERLTRYSETGFDSSGGTSVNAEKPLVSVWSLIIAKESVSRFRVIFFSFFIAVLVLLAITAWLIWKIWPVLKKTGFKQLISLHPIHPEGNGAPPTATQEGKKTENKPPEKMEEAKEEAEEGEEDSEEEPPKAKG